MNIKANNKRIVLAALAAPVLATIGIGLAAPAFAASERVEPAEPTEVAEAGMPTMPAEQQEQAVTPPDVAPKPVNSLPSDECTTHDVFIHTFC
jgi:hypothetical protein